MLQLFTQTHDFSRQHAGYSRSTLCDCPKQCEAEKRPNWDKRAPYRPWSNGQPAMSAMQVFAPPVTNPGQSLPLHALLPPRADPDPWFNQSLLLWTPLVSSTGDATSGKMHHSLRSLAAWQHGDPECSSRFNGTSPRKLAPSQANGGSRSWTLSPSLARAALEPEAPFPLLLAKCVVPHGTDVE